MKGPEKIESLFSLKVIHGSMYSIGNVIPVIAAFSFLQHRYLNRRHMHMTIPLVALITLGVVVATARDEESLLQTFSLLAKFSVLVSFIMFLSIRNLTDGMMERHRVAAAAGEGHAIDERLDTFLQVLQEIFGDDNEIPANLPVAPPLVLQQPVNNGTPPATRAAIGSMPTVIVTDSHLNNIDSRCPVCLKKFELGTEARQMPCNHIYHSHCIVEWLGLRNRCPKCSVGLPA